MTEGRTLYRAARLIDGTGAPPIDQGAVLVEGGRIAAIGRAEEFGQADGARVVDLGGWTLLPGLLDLHVHITSYLRQPDPPFNPEPFMALAAANNLRQALRTGVTTVRDVGAYKDVGFAARRAFEQGILPGARPFVCGRILCMTGGHGSEAPGIAREADGPDDVRRAVREMVKAGADFIKVTTNGPLNIPELTQAELDALVDEAHNAGRKVAAHASIRESARRVIQAGVDTLEHGSDLDEELIEQIVRRGIVIVPTNLIGHLIMERWEEMRHIPMFKRIPVRMAGHRRSIELAIKMGARIAAGTDTGPGLGGFAPVAREVELLADYGLPPTLAVQAATGVAAEALGQADSLGTLQPGRLADLIAVEGDPLADIRALAEVRFVAQAGRIYRDDRPGDGANDGGARLRI